MRWIRHSDFYRDEFLPQDAVGPVAASAGTAPRYWQWWRRAPSYPLLLFIRLWRKVISPLYGQVCAFYPSCSAYGLEAVTVHGLVKGSFLTGWRILRCNPFSSGGIDHVPASERAWPEGELPEIVRTNHPPIPRDPD